MNWIETPYAYVSYVLYYAMYACISPICTGLQKIFVNIFSIVCCNQLVDGQLNLGLERIIVIKSIGRKLAQRCPILVSMPMNHGAKQMQQVDVTCQKSREIILVRIYSKPQAQVK